MLKNPSKIPTSGFGNGWLPKFNHNFLVHRHICGKNFREDPFSTFDVKLLIDRQTNAEHCVTSLAEVMKWYITLYTCNILLSL